jgi:hypothetical protein
MKVQENSVAMTIDKKIEKYVLAVWEAKRPIVDAAISFANMKIESAAQVERVLKAAVRSVDRTGANYRADQKTLQRWLNEISSWQNLRPAERSALLGEIKPWTEHDQVKVRARIVGDRIDRELTYGALDVRRVIGNAMYLLFEWGMAQEGGVALCQQCQTYFLKDRTDQEVCSNRCRQRKFRAKETAT